MEQDMSKCDCGSGLKKLPATDGYGIFLCYTCAKCHDAKMQRYRSDIMERYDADEPIDED